VRLWQRLLIAKGFALEPDGIYGRRTEHATRVAQEWAGLPATGVADPETWRVVAKLRPKRHPIQTTRALLKRPKIIDARNGRAGFPVHPSRRWDGRALSAIKAQLWHHTGGPATFLADARFHVTSSYLARGGAPAIAYTLGIDRSGTLYVFNDPTSVTWHCDGGHNSDTLGVVILGNLQSTPPTLAQKRTAVWLMRALEQGTFAPFGGRWPRLTRTTTHRHVNSTTCPGDAGERFIRTKARAFVEVV
jgi:hypothetical protein